MGNRWWFSQTMTSSEGFLSCKFIFVMGHTPFNYYFHRYFYNEFKETNAYYWLHGILCFSQELYNHICLKIRTFWFLKTNILIRKFKHCNFGKLLPLHTKAWHFRQLPTVKLNDVCCTAAISVWSHLIYFYKVKAQCWIFFIGYFSQIFSLTSMMLLLV